MTKQEFVDAVAQRSGLGKREAAQAVDTIVLETRGGKTLGRDQITHQDSEVSRPPTATHTWA